MKRYLFLAVSLIVINYAFSMGIRRPKWPWDDGSSGSSKLNTCGGKNSLADSIVDCAKANPMHNELFGWRLSEVSNALETWLDPQDTNLWHQTVSKVNWEEAQRICPSGQRLPTFNEWSQAAQDYVHAVIELLRGQWLWSSSFYSTPSSYAAWGFEGRDGLLLVEDRTVKGNIMCVEPAVK